MTIPHLLRTRTADGRQKSKVALKSRKSEAQYARQLRKIAQHVGDIINGFPAGDPSSVTPIDYALQQYADLITPWARQVASTMIEDVNLRDKSMWADISKQLSAGLRRELQNTTVGDLTSALLSEQVTLIRSIPLEAAQRVHELTLTGLTDSTRASEIAREIRRSGQVSASRANLIARTEVSRTASALTEARARYVGSEGYIWRIVGDKDTRDSHYKMRNKFVYWDKPPTLDNLTGHAGCLPNCRCYPEPVLPE